MHIGADLQVDIYNQSLKQFNILFIDQEEYEEEYEEEFEAQPEERQEENIPETQEMPTTTIQNPQNFLAFKQLPGYETEYVRPSPDQSFANWAGTDSVTSSQLDKIRNERVPKR